MKLAANAPIMICPSAPMFQNFILKATAMPRDAMVRGMAFTITSLNLYLEPKAPLSMDWYTANGFWPVKI
jgi:hypothetical protein